MRLRLEASAMRYASVRVRVLVVDGATATGVGHLHLRRDWWQTIRTALLRGGALINLPIEIDETRDHGEA